MTSVFSNTHDKKKVADYVPQSKKFRNQSDSNAILFRSMKTLYYLDHTPLWMLNMKLKSGRDTIYQCKPRKSKYNPLHLSLQFTFFNEIRKNFSSHICDFAHCTIRKSYIDIYFLLCPNVFPLVNDALWPAFCLVLRHQQSKSRGLAEFQWVASYNCDYSGIWRGQ